MMTHTLWFTPCALLCVLASVSSGCNFGDNYNKSAQGCTAKEECAPNQLCTIDGLCVDKSTQPIDMGTRPEEMSPPLDMTADIARPDMSAPDLGTPIEDMLVMQDQPADMPSPPDMPQDMVDMTSPPDMSQLPLPPAYTQFDIANETFVLADAAVASSNELIMVGSVQNGEHAALLYYEQGSMPSGFKIDLPITRSSSFSKIVTDQSGDALVLGEYDTGTDGLQPFTLLIDASGQLQGYTFYNAGNDDRIQVGAIGTTNSDWLSAGVTSDGHLFVARLDRQARVDRVRRITLQGLPPEQDGLDVVAIRGHDDSAYVLTHVLEGDTRHHTIVSRHRASSLDPDWVQHVEDVLLYDLAITDQDEIYLAGQTAAGQGRLVVLEQNNGDFMESMITPGHSSRGLYWDEDDDLLWSVGGSPAGTQVYQLNLAGGSSSGVALPNLTQPEEGRTMPLVVWNDDLTALGNHTSDRVHVYPLSRTPQAACGSAPLGTPISSMTMPTPVLVTKSSYNDTITSLNDTRTTAIPTQQMNVSAMSPVCR